MTSKKSQFLSEIIHGERIYLSCLIFLSVLGVHRHFRSSLALPGILYNLRRRHGSIYKTACNVCDVLDKKIWRTVLWFGSKKTDFVNTSSTLQNKNSPKIRKYRLPKLCIRIFHELDTTHKCVVYGTNLSQFDI